LENIMTLLDRQNIPVGITIFLHKFDPNLTNMDGFQDIDDVVNEKLLEPISNVIPINYEYKVFKTTIFTVFEKDLLTKGDKK